jgi:hypothetical protein|tara:strand:- start:404 stop:727 length:324 start_codon:yes stop_codon:yes gene_type:complete
MKLSKRYLNRIIKNFLFEQEDKDAVSADYDTDRDALENIIKYKTDNEAVAIVIGKLKGGDEMKLPDKIKSILSVNASNEEKNNILDDETVYNEKDFTDKYGGLIKFV